MKQVGVKTKRVVQGLRKLMGNLADQMAWKKVVQGKMHWHQEALVALVWV
jgi:hypothetical protein